MKTIYSRSLTVIAAIVGLGIANVGNATIVTWEAAGVLTEIDRSGGLISEFASATVGTAFTVRYTFDTAAPLSRTRTGENGGFAYDWLSAIVSSELVIGGETLGRADVGSLVRLRDNFAGALNATLPPDMVVDGISLARDVASSAADGVASYAIIFRGPEDLNLYSGPTLPEDPAAILTLLSLNAFQFFDNGNCNSDACQESSFQGHVDSLRRVSVPEPSTIALLGLGLIGLAFVRRSRSAATI